MLSRPTRNLTIRIHRVKGRRLQRRCEWFRLDWGRPPLQVAGPFCQGHCGGDTLSAPVQQTVMVGGAAFSTTERKAPHSFTTGSRCQGSQRAASRPERVNPHTPRRRPPRDRGIGKASPVVDDPGAVLASPRRAQRRAGRPADRPDRLQPVAARAASWRPEPRSRASASRSVARTTPARASGREPASHRAPPASHRCRLHTSTPLRSPWQRMGSVVAPLPRAYARLGQSSFRNDVRHTRLRSDAIREV